MDIEMRKGACKNCGQIGMVEAPDISQDKIDEMVTKRCNCYESVFMREEEERKQRIRNHVANAVKGIETMFADWPEVRNLFIDKAQSVSEGTISSITVKMADSDTKASMSRKSNGSIKVTRKDSTTREIG